MRRRNAALAALAFVFLCPATFVRAHHGAGSVGGSGGPIYTLSANTLECGGWSMDVRFEHFDFDAFTDAELLALDTQGIHADSTDFAAGTFVTAAYGVSDNFTLTMQLPYFHLDNIREIHDIGLPPGPILSIVELEGSVGGLGDLAFYGFWNFYRSCDESTLGTFVVGLEVPSGKTDALTLDNNLFELDHQPGSGSWDPIVGLALSRSYDRFSLHTSVLYTMTNGGPRASTLGDVFRYDVAVVYRLLGEAGGHDHSDHEHEEGLHDHEGENHEGHPHEGHEHAPVAPPDDNKFTPHVHPTAYHPNHDDAPAAEPTTSPYSSNEIAGYFDEEHHDHEDLVQCWILDGMLELNGISLGQNVLDGAVDDSSGGHVLFLSPGLRLTRCERWSMFASAGFPIVQHQNLGEHRVDARYTLGLNVGF